ncbi:MAG: hypothetical protein JXR96_22360 [Deltaproteobacteria bacterium]|nr:hypothetical protein [Deltaproteobacteria bacterium]
MLRFGFGIIFLGMAASLTVAGVQWATALHELSGPDGLGWEATPFTHHVTLPLRADDISAIYASRWREDHLLLRVRTAPDAFVDLDPSSYRALVDRGRLFVQGMVTSSLPRDFLARPGHPAPPPRGERLLVVLHRGEPYPVGDAGYLFALAALGLLLAASAFRRFLRHRRPRDPDAPAAGLLERLAARHPGLFEALGRYQLNGFGIELLDFHAHEPDGSFLATRWLTAGFLPIGPVSRVRIRSLSERLRLWIPFVLSVSGTDFEILERLPVDRSRSLRVYLFHYLVFLPLAVGPVAGLFFCYVLARPDLSALAIWGLLGACLAWGILMVWMQHRVMKRPPPAEEGT